MNSKERVAIAISPFLGYFMITDNLIAVVVIIIWMIIIYPWGQ